jgi:hypothetical protein
VLMQTGPRHEPATGKASATCHEEWSSGDVWVAEDVQSVRVCELAACMYVRDGAVRPCLPPWVLVVSEVTVWRRQRFERLDKGPQEAGGWGPTCGTSPAKPVVSDSLRNGADLADHALF